MEGRWGVSAYEEGDVKGSGDAERFWESQEEGCSWIGVISWCRKWVGMIVPIVVRMVGMGDRRLLIKGGVLTAGLGMTAAWPLAVWFLIPQMDRQGTVGVSHNPVFVYNVVVDYVRGIALSLGWMFAYHSFPVMRWLILFGVCACVLCCLLLLVIKGKAMRPFALSITVAWTLYFIAVSCSFYGYNNWNGNLGCYNIGGKYTLFLCPIIIVTLTVGAHAAMHWMRGKHVGLHKVMRFVCVFMVMFFCLTELIKLNADHWRKDDVREVVSAWYENELYDSETLIHQWDDAMFQFYLTHHESYRESYQDKIEAAGIWIREAGHDEMESKLWEMGYLDLKDFYFVSPYSEGSSKSYRTFVSVMKANGFQVDVMYEGVSALLYCHKFPDFGTN